jgi:hypothetical protein
LSVNGRTSWRIKDNAPISWFSFKHRDAQSSPRTAEFDGSNVYWIEAFSVGLYRRTIGDLSNCLGRYEPTEKSLRMGTVMWICLSVSLVGWPI